MRNYFAALAISAALLSSPLTLVAGQKDDQKIPVTRDGKPDLTGVWAGPGFDWKPGAKYSSVPNPANTDFGETGLPFKPGGEQLWKRKKTGDLLNDDPTAFCLPWGFPAEPLVPRAQQFFQTSQTLVIIYEDMRMFRIIPLDGR